MRQFAIGDIHGCAKALRSLIEEIAPGPDDELIFLGDYIDRGPDSKDVIEQIIALQKVCRVIALRGNHEIMLMGVIAGLDDTIWSHCGGQATLASYGGTLDKIPADHLEFLRSLQAYHVTEESIFVHANYVASISMDLQEETTLFWKHLDFPRPSAHCSGKRVFLGHTPQPGGNVLDLGHLVCIDTYCFGGGYLTAMETATCDLWQTDRHGHVRRAPLKSFKERIDKTAKFLGSTLRSIKRPPS